MSKRKMHFGNWLTYLGYRLLEGTSFLLPLPLYYAAGQIIGLCAYYLLPRYRKLAQHNLEIAFSKEKTETEITHLVKKHFITLGANLLSSIKLTTIREKNLYNYVEYEGREILEPHTAKGLPIIYLAGHIGAWELLAQIESLAPNVKPSTLYQPLSNPYMNAHVLRKRQRTGLKAFDRKDGFNAPIAHLRKGGSVGMMVDQHAGYRGIWCPLFGRLASTSNLAPLMAARSGAKMFPLSVTTKGRAKWKVNLSNPLEVTQNDTIETTTAKMNLLVEEMIRKSPQDWFWVHNRWKTPKPFFLIEKYKRGFCLPPDFFEEDLQSFKILVISPNSLGKCSIALPALRAISRGRPDAKVTILCNEDLVEFWQGIDEVKNVINRSSQDSVRLANNKIAFEGPFDVAVLFTNSQNSAIEANRAGIPHIVGYSNKSRDKFIDHKIIQENPSEDPEHYLKIARAVGSKIT